MYLPIIGLEIHVEPKTRSKMFCDCPADHFAVEANSHTCPVCLGLPGALPIPNWSAIQHCLKLGLALDCQINQLSKFDRKNYFYPDLPKGYQISQYDLPFCHQGKFRFPLVDKQTKELDWQTVRITRVHMEEDTGKLVHQTINGQDVSLVDYNRSGVPLIEIVTEPDIHDAATAKHFLKWLSLTLQHLGISDCDMEKGQMRLEANISVVETDSDQSYQLPDYKVEVKNVNSFRYIEKAIEYEIQRQIKILQSGQVPVQETRGYSEDKDQTFSQRTKETAQDYRYFPEPDIPPIELTADQISDIKQQLTGHPVIQFEQLVQNYQLRPDLAQIIVSNSQLSSVYFPLLTDKEIDAVKLAKLIVNKKIISLDSTQAVKQAYLKLTQEKPKLDPAKLQTIVNQVIQQQADAVSDYHKGKESAIGFLLGAVMKASQGQADPQTARQFLVQALKKAKID